MVGNDDLTPPLFSHLKISTLFVARAGRTVTYK